MRETRVKSSREKKNQIELSQSSFLRTIIVGILFIVTAIIIFAFMFYFAYLFKERFIRIMFRVIILGIGIVSYIIILKEIIGRSIKN